ncbi:DUF1553 domain-containing protein [Fuerstiella marisgermanici]|uniref:Planctomycete cytochrome C n=1 Tax=Fuerstiella marisgermanici TaxID=1891926 RepID=A0A1P8WL57_9PLAN|nr:DUF1553 domain-containing protein [Fuerstiella marisgermanici]APZ94783.1 Planctomycete cytochrome C [Fuerstiella marisgermanici]
MRLPPRYLAPLTFLALFAITATAAADINYTRDIKPILKAKCYACHGALKQEAGLRLDTVKLMRAGGDSGPAIDLEDASGSHLLDRISSHDEDLRMPPEGEPLSPEQITLVKRWLAEGASAPLDEKPQANPATHWAFQPVQQVSPPGDGHPIDAFIDRKLNAAGLQRAPLADSTALVRRMFLDLHGLLPTPQQLQKWKQHFADGGTTDLLVDELLESPRYGERWAQHWLDVVRYADTHGFEVNTPRPNAWPYRDYVIDAFNLDKPYDQFVFEQLAGDTADADAATGFMVAAAALLPGQIGKDEESKRLARQDELDEIIIGTTATFLGLTVGCARCHDHKFDPIPQKDYYAFQAFFAGVDYGDRQISGSEVEERRLQASKLQPRIDEIRSKLQAFRPLASTGRAIIIDDENADRVTSLKPKNGHGKNPAGSGRGYRDDIGDGSRYGNLSKGRYTWWDNKPGEDVFTWDPAAEGRFRLWISWGVHGSGVHTRDARYVLDLDGDLATIDDQKEIARADQYYFAGVSKGKTVQKPLWSGLLDVGVHDFNKSTRLILRGGDTGTGITADVIVLQETEQQSDLPQFRSPVDAATNIERFAPTHAKFVRFTSFETIDQNRHEPCIDELEVLTAGPDATNIALASHGAIATSSGDYSNSGRHQLKHVNDGKYGNGRSWISNEKGQGWVQLEFPEATMIDRVAWGRDREGKFKDRLPVRYQIESSLDGKSWTLLASSDDRLPLGTPHDDVVALVRNATTLGGSDVAALATELKKLEQRQTELQKPQLVFAGRFREPDTTFVLNRGNPEQKLDEISPYVPTSIGATRLPPDSGDRERRTVLAKWLTEKNNPLTARVMVNRIWLYHFGTGLVETPSDFGLNGAAPSHPELLDWLANEFVSNGWSVKHMHRLIMSSGTYQQSAVPAAGTSGRTVDGNNRLLWHYPSRRMEAEAIRDCMLQISGQLNLKAGGPGFNFFKSRGGLSGFPPVEEFTPEQKRRMIYAHKIRMERVPIFGAFDCPDAGLPTPVRSRSTTAIQALNLFNSSFVIGQADAFARRLKAEAGDDVNAQVALAFRLAIGRAPADIEAQAAASSVAKHGLSPLCRALFNSSEFLFIP